MVLPKQIQQRLQQLNLIAARAVALLKESPDPEQEMVWAEDRLSDQNLLAAGELWKERKDPEAWVEAALVENPDIFEISLPWSKERNNHPETAESFNQLILSLIPTEGGL